MSRVAGTGLRPSERDKYGIVASCLDLETNEPWTFEARGTQGEAVREICERIDARPGEWRIVCLSNPPTIGRDLHGSRVRLERLDAGRLASVTGGERTLDKPNFPEYSMLSRIKRIDLLHPRMLGASTGSVGGKMSRADAA